MAQMAFPGGHQRIFHELASELSSQYRRQGRLRGSRKRSRAVSCATFYFDKQTGLLIANGSIRQFGGRPRSDANRLSDYRRWQASSCRSSASWMGQRPRRVRPHRNPSERSGRRLEVRQTSETGYAAKITSRTTQRAAIASSTWERTPRCALRNEAPQRCGSPALLRQGESVEFIAPNVLG